MYEFRVETLIENGRIAREAVDEIVRWIRDERESDAIPLDVPEDMIALFLISCENDIENTKKTVKAYFKIKRKSPEIFNGRDIDERKDLQQAVEVVRAASLPERTAENYAIHFFKLKDTNYARANLAVSLKLACMLLDVTQRRHPCDGLVVVMDMAGVGFMHLTLFRLGPVRAFLHFLQEAFPMKLRRIYVLNGNYLFDRMLALVRAFLSAEILDMMEVFPPDVDMDDFYKNHIPAKCMPEEYGGELPTLDELHEATMRQLREIKPFFLVEEKLRKSVDKKE